MLGTDGRVKSMETRLEWYTEKRALCTYYIIDFILLIVRCVYLAEIIITQKIHSGTPGQKAWDLDASN